MSHLRAAKTAKAEFTRQSSRRNSRYARIFGEDVVWVVKISVGGRYSGLRFVPLDTLITTARPMCTVCYTHTYMRCVFYNKVHITPAVANVEQYNRVHLRHSRALSSFVFPPNYFVNFLLYFAGVCYAFIIIFFSLLANCLNCFLYLWVTFADVVSNFQVNNRICTCLSNLQNYL